jgi:cytochrome P450
MNTLPPQPTTRFFGLNLAHKLQQANQINFISELAELGDIVYLKILHAQFYLILHPDHVHQIMVEEAHKVNKAFIQKKVIGEFSGNGLLNSDGDFWKRQRKLTQPAFHAKRVAGYADLMINQTARMLDSWQFGAEYDIAREMMKLTLGIVSEALFGAHLEGRAEQIGDKVTITQDMSNRKMAALMPVPNWVPTRRHLTEQQAIKDLHRLIMDIVQSRRASNEDRGDLLSMLLMAQDESGGQMDDAQVRDEAITLFIAGYETTANALAWTFHLLAQNPDVEARLREEIDSVLGDRPPRMNDLRNLPYTDKVLKESMRLYPPIWAFLRDVVEDIQVGGYTIPKGSMIQFNPHATQRDARWFPDPLKFDPERFSEGWEKRIPKGAYFPFGMGPRICIGQYFAIMEAQIILAMIIQRCQLRIVPGQTIVPQPLIAQRPRDGLKMVINARVQVPIADPV